MPIDPQIPLGVQVPQINPVAYYAAGQNMADRRALEQQRQAQAQKIQEQEMRQQRIAQIVQSAVDPQTGTFNTDEALKGLRASGFGAEADAMQAKADASFKSARESAKVDLETRDLELKQLMQKGRAVMQVGGTDPAAWQSFVTDVAKSKTLGPQIAAGMPTRFDPAFMSKALEWGDDQTQAITRFKNVGDALDNAPKTAKGWADLGAQLLSAPGIQPKEQQDTLGILEAHGMPKDIAQMFVGKAPADIAQMGMTPEQRAQQAGQAAALANTQANQQAQGSREDQRIEIERQRLAQDAARGQSDDVRVSVQGMKAGMLPPQLPGRASKEYTAVMAEATRQGFDLAKANEDWVATQKHLATMNGQQQERLRQAISFTKESLPLVRQLITQWDSSGLPVLSKAALDAAAAGAGTKEQQSLAVRLKGQIADLTSEIGTVYKGGNSSTDESLKLAGQNLQGDWSKQAGLDALDQIEKNIGFRENSMRNSRAVTSGGENVYDRSKASATPPTDKTQVWSSPRGAMKWNGTMWVPQ